MSLGGHSRNKAIDIEIHICEYCKTFNHRSQMLRRLNDYCWGAEWYWVCFDCLSPREEIKKIKQNIPDGRPVRSSTT